jgi:ComEC/Rec2-related protein
VFCVISIFQTKFLYVSVIFLTAGITGFHAPVRFSEYSRKAVYTGTVVSEEHFGSYHRLHVHLKEIEVNGSRFPVRVIVRLYAPGTRVLLGSDISVHGSLRSARTRVDRLSLSGSINRISRSHDFPWGFVHSLRNYVERTFRTHFSGVHNDLANGLVVGGSGHLPPSLRDIFARAGILHILAVSGLHVGFVCLFGYALFSITFLPRTVKFIGVIVLMVCYLFLTSFRPSVCRAAYMAVLFGTALLLQRNVSRMHIANVAAIGLLVFDPLLLFSLSAQLSFAAVYGILYLYPKAQRHVLQHITWRPLRTLGTFLAVSCAAQLFAAPLVIHYFKRVSLVAPLTNLVVIPLTTCIVFLLYTMLAVSGVWYTGGHILGNVVLPLIDALIHITRFSAALPFAALHLTIPLSLLSGIWGLCIPRARRYVVYGMIVLLCLNGAALFSKRMVIVHYRDLVLIDCPDRNTILWSQKQPDVSVLSQILDKPGKPYADFAITPVFEKDIAKQWIETPAPFTQLKVHYGNIAIRVDSTLRVQYGDQEYHCGHTEQASTPGDDICYSLSNGTRTMRYVTTYSGSIFDDLITELWMMVAQCLLFF